MARSERGALRASVIDYVKEQGTRQFRTVDVRDALGLPETSTHISTMLTRLDAEGVIKRVRPGVFVARKRRRKNPGAQYDASDLSRSALVPQVIDVLQRQGATRTYAIADRIGSSRTNMSRLLARMVELGMIERVANGLYAPLGVVGPVESNGSHVARTYDRKRGVDQRVADALDALKLKNPDTLLLMQWLDMTRELCNAS